MSKVNIFLFLRELFCFLNIHIHSGNGEENLPILNTTLIKEGLDFARNLANHFKYYPDKQQAAKFQCGIFQGTL